MRYQIQLTAIISRLEAQAQSNTCDSIWHMRLQTSQQHYTLHYTMCYVIACDVHGICGDEMMQRIQSDCKAAKKKTRKK